MQTNVKMSDDVEEEKEKSTSLTRNIGRFLSGLTMKTLQLYELFAKFAISKTLFLNFY